MHYQPDVPTIASVTVFCQADMPKHGIGSTLGDPVDGDAEIFETSDGAYADAVVHRHDDGIARVPVKNTLKAN
jgi:hypothetical protein